MIDSGGMLERISIPAVGVLDRTGDIGSRASLWSLCSFRVIELVVRACPHTTQP